MILARFPKNSKGFTLVELMTVVAIIGALAALGVPQYKKMQRKAKRAEANMLLGVIGSAEAAFFAEYNAYGSNMGGIGAEMESDPQYYNAGFLTAEGIPEYPEETGGRHCIVGDECRASDDAVFPPGFPGYSRATIRAPRTMAVRDTIATGFRATIPDPNNNAEVIDLGLAGDTCIDRIGAPSNRTQDPVPGFGVAQMGYSRVANQNTQPNYTAIAAGNLYQNGDASRWDCVSINNVREIVLIQDGS